MKTFSRHQQPGAETEGVGHTIRFSSDHPSDTEKALTDFEAFSYPEPHLDQKRFLDNHAKSGTTMTSTGLLIEKLREVAMGFQANRAIERIFWFHGLEFHNLCRLPACGGIALGRHRDQLTHMRERYPAWTQ